MNKNSVYLLSGVHNFLEHTKRFILCVKKQGYPHLKVVLVNDGSTDGTEEYITEEYPEIFLLKGNGTLWWTGSLFYGIEEILRHATKDDFILTINNDCEFRNDYVETLVKTSLEHNRAIVGSLIVDRRDKLTVIDAGLQLNWAKGKIVPHERGKLTKQMSYKSIQTEIDTLTTKGTIYPIEVFQSIGNFDRIHLPHYISDYEFACRAKRKGFQLLLSYNAVLYNDIERTGFGDIPANISLNKLFNLLFSRKSKINIIDHFWFITLSCPLKYKPINYLRIFLKGLFIVSFAFPFLKLRSLLPQIKKIHA
ncbi:MAG: glycosyltransferase family 2 protein [Bacteroidetes bacterium]|nr:MAG: glycosyltransferase family 2 protein [Bacteroidota bacterium]